MREHRGIFPRTPGSGVHPIVSANDGDGQGDEADDADEEEQEEQHRHDEEEEQEAEPLSTAPDTVEYQ